MSFEPASLPRRLASCVYDALLCSGIAMLSALIISAIGTPMKGDSEIVYDNPDLLMFQILIVGVSTTLVVAFLVWCWAKKGQTLGMQSWRMRVTQINGENISFGQAFVRVLVGCVSIAALGLGFWWALIDPERRTWHDIASRSILVFNPNFGKKKKA